MDTQRSEKVVPNILCGPWKAIGSYEVNRYGLVRKGERARGSLRPGQLLRPMKKSRHAQMSYSITLQTERRIVGAEDLVREVHGKEMLPVEGLFEKILRIIDFNKKKTRTSSDARAHTPVSGNRRCHDCGCPTNNYRCDVCWAKIRGSGKVGLEAIDFGCEIVLPGIAV